MTSNATTTGSAAARSGTTIITGGTRTATTAFGRSRNKKYKVPTLDADGTDFVYWKHRVKRALRIARLWGLIDGTEPRPSAADATALEDWLLKNEEALASVAGS